MTHKQDVVANKRRNLRLLLTVKTQGNHVGFWGLLKSLQISDMKFRL